MVRGRAGTWPVRLPRLLRRGCEADRTSPQVSARPTTGSARGTEPDSHTTSAVLPISSQNLVAGGFRFLAPWGSSANSGASQRNSCSGKPGRMQPGSSRSTAAYHSASGSLPHIAFPVARLPTPVPASNAVRSHSTGTEPVHRGRSRSALARSDCPRRRTPLPVARHHVVFPVALGPSTAMVTGPLYACPECPCTPGDQSRAPFAQ